MTYQRLQTLSILVVDDDYARRTVLTDFLEGAGAFVTSVSSIAQTLHILQSFTPDLLISGLVLPAQSRCLIQQVRQHEIVQGGSALPALAIVESNLDSPGLLMAGFQACFPPPWGTEAMIQGIEYMLQAIAELSAQGSHLRPVQLLPVSAHLHTNQRLPLQVASKLVPATGGGAFRNLDRH